MCFTSMFHSTDPFTLMVMVSSVLLLELIGAKLHMCTLGGCIHLGLTQPRSGLAFVIK